MGAFLYLIGLAIFMIILIYGDDILTLLTALVTRRQGAAIDGLERENELLRLKADGSTALLRAIMADDRATLPYELEQRVQVHLITYPPKLEPSSKKNKKKLM